jgi:recombination protein RecA
MAKIGKTVKVNRLDSLVSSIQKSFGISAAKMGALQQQLRSIPTGSLALDYELGTGGWPMGYLCGVFGQRDIGKSSLIGFSAIRNAQAMGLNCAYISVEPVGDENWESWAVKNGVNVDELLLTWPTTGEEAFEMLHMVLRSNAVDLVIFDSVGALLGEVELKEDGKPRQGGQAGLITWGVKVAAPLAFRNKVAVLMFNQVRHDMRPGVKGVVYKQPGGEALEHSEAIIVHLRAGSTRYTVKDNGTDVLVGREIVAHIVRNKLSEGTGRRAVFDYFFAETDQYPFGIDVASDIINTAMRAGVITRAGSYYTLPSGQRLQGQKSVGEYLAANPDEMAAIRELVLKAMLERNLKITTMSEEIKDDETI